MIVCEAPFEPPYRLSLPGHHNNTIAKAERVLGVLGDALRAFASGRTDDWDVWLPLAVLAIRVKSAASTLGGELTPFFIDRGDTRACRCPSPTCEPPENHRRPTRLG